jgi:Mannosyltransferase (PIG-V)
VGISTLREESTVTTDRDLRRRAVTFSILVFLVMRISVSLLGLAVGHIPANEASIDPGTAPQATPGVHNLWDGTYRLDAAWFIDIADQGYDFWPDHTAAFFPGYPLAIRAVSAIPGVGTLAAAILVSNASLVGAFVILYLLTTHELSERAARTTILVMAAFPTSFFLVAPYSESLYLLLVLWSFWEARKRRWPAAGVAGALAGLTRQIGFVMTPVLLLAVRETGWRRRAAAAVCIAALGPLAYFMWWQMQGGNLLAPFHAQAEWYRHFRFPVITLLRGLYEAWIAKLNPDGGYWASDAALTIIAIGGVVTVAKKVPLSYVVFAGVSILVPLCYPYTGRDLLSMSRFVLPLFPAFWGVALWLKRRWALAAWLAISIPLAAWHTVLFMHYRHIY